MSAKAGIQEMLLDSVSSTERRLRTENDIPLLAAGLFIEQIVIPAEAVIQT